MGPNTDLYSTALVIGYIAMLSPGFMFANDMMTLYSR